MKKKPLPELTPGQREYLNSFIVMTVNRGRRAEKAMRFSIKRQYREAVWLWKKHFSRRLTSDETHNLKLSITR